MGLHGAGQGDETTNTLLHVHEFEHVLAALIGSSDLVLSQKRVRWAVRLAQVVKYF